jgi:hypothetical protein
MAWSRWSGAGALAATKLGKRPTSVHPVATAVGWRAVSCYPQAVKPKAGSGTYVIRK